MKNTWLVTGGAGFIGSSVVGQLVKKGEKVVVLDNFSTGQLKYLAPFKNKIKIIKGDVSNLQHVKKAVKGVNYIIHLAAFRSVEQSVKQPKIIYDINVTGTINILEEARIQKVKKVVFASSSSVYGEVKSSKSQVEKDSLGANLQSPYALGKLMAEKYCELYSEVYGLSTICLRYFNVYGPNMNSNKYSLVLESFITAIKKNKSAEIHWDGKQSRDFVNVLDVADITIKSAKKHKILHGVYNIGNGKASSVLDILHALECVSGKTAKKVYKPKRAGDVRKTLANINKAKRELGFKAKINLATGIKKVWQSYN
ncbi:MAG: SDR family NAD(P)-dependent oxidoreductase [Elusimicrobiaceae bacterium]|jgi:nucleoside-diphosphate-sugar epimerase|nr:SDR family NAD(P)-dependent oxidoreductase [Elusimicrobiaceae bacterium]MBT3955645.1 SDR family NAD(P)-dependent oxidoreductase [Elusimicrobiaceae bacterium]MBT4008516.1 SDR family NAD(P)-dependent oxidoreductase [Elusimicrobiaceae bacterium]MBT4403404.1 SDR family NAD(P)-dependent oxidoreductase [Elusimicrobiaceae bacterium]MBT4439707.1 SDR family NAD(P)-dependent oxidoreductase [Elusimicrobiaceae bacterium]